MKAEDVKRGKRAPAQALAQAPAPDPTLETIASIDNVSLRYRYTAFGKVGPAKKRANEDYILTDESFNRIISRYVCTKGSQDGTESVCKGSTGDTISRSNRFPVKLPNFTDLISRDERQWLTNHHPKKVGRSIRLDKQLEQLLAKQKQEEQSQADEVGVQLPSFRKLSPDAGSEPECHVSNNNFGLLDAPERGDSTAAPLLLEAPSLCDSRNLALKCTQQYPDRATAPLDKVRSIFL